MNTLSSKAVTFLVGLAAGFILAAVIIGRAHRAGEPVSPGVAPEPRVTVPESQAPPPQIRRRAPVVEAPAAPPAFPLFSAQTLEEPQPTPHRIPQPPVEIVSLDARVTESNDSWDKYAWQLVLRSRSDEALVCSAVIKFLDDAGFIVDQDTARGLSLNPHAQETFTGYQLISQPAAKNVRSTKAEVSVK